MTPHEIFALLADETRLRCLLLLYKKKEVCVCEFSYALESIQPKISRHLSYLRKAGLLLDERRGQWVYYSFNQSLPDWVKQIIAVTLENLVHQEPYSSDLKRLCSKANMC